MRDHRTRPTPVTLSGRRNKPLGMVATAHRVRAHFERRRAAAQTPQDIISVASDYVRSAMSGADADTARMVALEHAAAMVAAGDRLLAARVAQAYDYVA
jgi:hypothetical protein